MDNNSEDKIARIYSIVSKEKKVKINWLLVVTKISFEELQSIVEKLGFVIKGEYVALSTEAKKIPDESIWVPSTIVKEFSSSEISTQIKEKYCPTCAIPIKGTEGVDRLFGTCPNCGQIFEELFYTKLEKEYFRKRCLRCGAINPVKVKFCFNCASERLERIIPKTEASTKKINNSRKFLKKHQVDAIVLLILSVIWIVVATTTAAVKGFEELASTIVVTVLYILGALFLYWPLYYLEKYSAYLKYKRYWEEE